MRLLASSPATGGSGRPRRSGRKTLTRAATAMSVFLAAAVLSLSSSPLTPAAAATRTQVAAWSTGLNQGGPGFSDQTIREVVHLSSGGSTVRLQLSNLRGTSTLTVGHVDVAVQSSGGVPVAGTHHRVTFGGSTGVTLAVGAEQVSDEVALSTSADENLLVSIYVSNTIDTSSWHPNAQATTWISSSGDHAADDTVASYPTHTYASYLLGGLWVNSATAAGTLVALGDSITDGVKSSVNADRRYPDDLARRLAAVSGGPHLSVANVGIGGNRVLADGSANSGLSALHRFAHDALAQPNVKTVLLLEGINDITYNSASASSITSGYQTLITQAHAAGVRVVAATVMPFNGMSGYTAARETIRQQVNTWIRTSGAFDAVLDFDLAVRNPADATTLLPAYDSGDHIHPNDAGYQAMADAVTLSALG
ncbi:SGNH/GDSL hydrolase family protein [Streptomyces sp. NPDC004542]|uniref:SGNH/GDSL hydrolase family protein n=1 Tax=Streptomyces sp. NPDC004542 TaxID=3154281 RepID=UPI0033B97426